MNHSVSIFPVKSFDKQPFSPRGDGPVSSSLFPLLARRSLRPEWRGLFYSNDRLSVQSPLILVARAKPQIFVITFRHDHDWKYETSPPEHVSEGPAVCSVILLFLRSPPSFHHLPPFLLRLLCAWTSSCLQPHRCRPFLSWLLKRRQSLSHFSGDRLKSKSVTRWQEPGPEHWRCHSSLLFTNDIKRNKWLGCNSSYVWTQI